MVFLFSYHMQFDFGILTVLYRQNNSVTHCKCKVITLYAFIVVFCCDKKSLLNYSGVLSKFFLPPIGLFHISLIQLISKYPMMGIIYLTPCEHVMSFISCLKTLVLFHEKLLMQKFVSYCFVIVRTKYTIMKTWLE